MRHRSRPPAPATGTILGLAAHNRRHHFRQAVRSLAYVKVDSSNGGVVRDVSESGIATQPLSPLQPGQKVQLRIDLPGPNLRLETEGRVAWFDPSGQAGIQFLELAPRSRHLLKQWIFAQLLADAYRSAGAVPAELLFSQSSRTAIRLDEGTARSGRLAVERGRSSQLKLLGLPMSLKSFSTLVDGMVLLCAVLLFSVVALTLTDTLPAWPVATLLLAGATAIFLALYWFLFSFWFGVTPGGRLAELAGLDVRKRRSGEERVRFR